MAPKGSRDTEDRIEHSLQHVSTRTDLISDSVASFGSAATSLGRENGKLDARNAPHKEYRLNSEQSMSSPSCLFLDKLPGELRTSIYEYVFREPSGTIVVDLRKDIVKSTYSKTSSINLALTCRQIYGEYGSLRYAVNKVHIFVPVFSTSSAASTGERQRRDLIASRLREVADSQTETKQLNRLRLFLGRLPRLPDLRWTEFFSSWMSIRDAVVCLLGICSSMELSFEVSLAKSMIAQHRFTIDTADSKLETVELLFPDGSAAETSRLEQERMRRIKATIA